MTFRDSIAKATFALALSELLSGCKNNPFPPEYTQAPWEFIQSVGGIALGEPYIDSESGSLMIPIIQDFSGNRRVTVEPTRINSGYECILLLPRFRRGNFPGRTDLYVISYYSDASLKLVSFLPNSCNQVEIPQNEIYGFSRWRVFYMDNSLTPHIGANLIGEFTL